MSASVLEQYTGEDNDIQDKQELLWHNHCTGLRDIASLSLSPSIYLSICGLKHFPHCWFEEQNSRPGLASRIGKEESQLFFFFFFLFLHMNRNDDTNTCYVCNDFSKCSICLQNPESFLRSSTHHLTITCTFPLLKSNSSGRWSSLCIWYNSTGFHRLRKGVTDVVGCMSESWGLTDNSAVSPRASLDPHSWVFVCVSVYIQLYRCILYEPHRVVMESGLHLVHRRTRLHLFAHRWIFALRVHIVFLANSMERIFQMMLRDDFCSSTFRMQVSFWTLCIVLFYSKNTHKRLFLQTHHMSEMSISLQV